MSAFQPWTEPHWKTSRVATKKAKEKRRRKLKATEREEKGDVRKRDRHCRFPKCGCRHIGEIVKTFGEVSHQVHKGMGGNPTGDRSTAEQMVLLCKWRHQDAKFSRHKGTLRPVFLTPAKFDGPIAWDILWGNEWRELARERAVQDFEPFTDWQEEVLDELAGMEQ